MYKLPILDYSFEALEPFIDTHTLGLHYHKHFQNYLNQLNDLLDKNNYDYRYDVNELLYHINEFSQDDKKDILFNLGGVLNHSLYFKCMSPNNVKPNGRLKYYIEEKYGSYDKFWKEFKDKAKKIKGSGYTFLVIKNNELDIVNIANQDIPLVSGYVPLFAIDMWEHAYYLNYENNKKEYIENFKEIADFSYANQIFNQLMNDIS